MLLCVCVVAQMLGAPVTFLDLLNSGIIAQSEPISEDLKTWRPLRSQRVSSCTSPAGLDRIGVPPPFCLGRSHRHYGIAQPAASSLLVHALHVMNLRANDSKTECSWRVLSSVEMHYVVISQDEVGDL